MTRSCGAVWAKQGKQTDFMRVRAGTHMCEHVEAQRTCVITQRQGSLSGPREPPVATPPPQCWDYRLTHVTTLDHFFTHRFWDSNSCPCMTLSCLHPAQSQDETTTLHCYRSCQHLCWVPLCSETVLLSNLGSRQTLQLRWEFREVHFAVRVFVRCFIHPSLCLPNSSLIHSLLYFFANSLISPFAI